MRNLWCFIVVLALYIPCSAYAATQNTDLSDLKDLPTIEKLMNFNDTAPFGPESRQYFRSLRDQLTQAPVSERVNLLNKLAEKTKWGTYQRFITYYVCAWYGLDYSKRLDYLVHATFWWEWRIGPEEQRPFCFDEDSIALLFELYKRNHDFQLLHDLMTTQSDAAGAETIEGLIWEAMDNHARGVLHVAELSSKGFKLVLHLLTLNPDECGYPEIDKKSQNAFKRFVQRTAEDSRDPLSSIAKRLVEASHCNGKR